MASIGQVVEALRGALDRLPFAQLAEAEEQAGEGRAHLERVTVGSLQDDVLQTLSWFDKTTDGITELQQQLTTIQQRITTLINNLEGGGPPTTAPARTSAPRSAVPPRLAGGDTTPATLLARLPERSESNRKTNGVWIDGAGRGHEVVSGRDEGYQLAVDTLRELGLARHAASCGPRPTSK